MAIANLMQFESVLADLTRTADKVNYATATSTKFEDARRTFHETVDVLKRKEPITKLLAARINKACEIFISELPGGERVMDQLYDLQDYLEFNPPA
jgi:hypothetical protein